MQKNQLAMKKRMEVDGEQWPAVISIGETGSEKDVIEIADGDVKRTIDNGQRSVKPRECVMAIERGAPINKKLQDWFYNNEYHEVIIVYIDADGSEFARELLSDCRCVKYSHVDWEATTAQQAKINFTLAPYDQHWL